MGLTLLETDQDLCPGWLPPVPPDLVSPQERSSPGPPTPIVVRFPTTQNFAHYSCVVSFIYVIAPRPTLYRKGVH